MSGSRATPAAAPLLPAARPSKSDRGRQTPIESRESTETARIHSSIPLGFDSPGSLLWVLIALDIFGLGSSWKRSELVLPGYPSLTHLAFAVDSLGPSVLTRLELLEGLVGNPHNASKPPGSKLDGKLKSSRQFRFPPLENMGP